MCFGKVFVTLLALPWLNHAMNRQEIKMLSGNNTVFIIYKSPHDRLWHVLEKIQDELTRHANVSTCTPEKTDICVTTNQCNKIEALLFNSPQNATCSLLVYKEDVLHTDSNRPTPLKVWGFGLVSVGIISLSGLFGGLFWPLINSNFYNQMMRVLIGLAVGSLTATSTFQLIPEGFEMKENQNYLNTAVVMWASLWMLYMFEVLSKIVFHKTDNDNGQELDNHPQTVKVSTSHNGDNHDASPDEMAEEGLLSKSSNVNNTTPLSENEATPYTAFKSLSKSAENTARERHRSKTTVAYMIIFGDALHNFIDGMSIGAGYSKDLSAGLGISIAIACEEFPHELGDFAILINSGMPVKKALLYNFLSACTSFGGLVLGILMGELETSVYIFAFAGGLFLYVSLADLMPELNKMVDDELTNSKSSALMVLLLQNIGIFMGATTLYFITKHPVTIS